MDADWEIGGFVMMMVVVCFLDEEAGTGETAADGFLGFQDHLFREVKGLDGFLKKGQGHAKVEQGGAEHVATDAGGAVEMEMGRRHQIRILNKQAGIEGGCGLGDRGIREREGERERSR